MRLRGHFDLWPQLSVDANGARNAVVTEDGVAFLTDAPEGKILVVTPASHH